MSVIINGTDGVQFNDSSLQGAAASPYGLKNRIINGDMRIDQKNAGASVTPTGDAYTLDRWQLSIGVSSKLSVQRSTTAPTGFINSALITTASAYTASAADYLSYCTKIEGLNISDLAWGTASAKTVTLSFQVRSSLTGTFSGALQNSGASRSYPFTFSIGSANTWETKSITIVGDTSGTWLTTNGIGIEVHFNMGSGSDRLGTAGAWNSNWNTGATGSVALVQTNGATFYLTGVQLEVGSTATPFERRMYGTELALCYRYFYKKNFNQSASDMVANVQAYSATSVYGKLFDLPVEMRAVPTVAVSSVGHFRPTGSDSSFKGAFTTCDFTQGTNTFQITAAAFTGSSGLTAGNSSVMYNNTTSAWISASAEL